MKLILCKLGITKKKKKMCIIGKNNLLNQRDVLKKYINFIRKHP